MPNDGMHRDGWPQCTVCGTRRPLYALDSAGICKPNEKGVRWCNRMFQSAVLSTIDDPDCDCGSCTVTALVEVDNANPVDADRTGTPPDAQAEPAVEAARAPRRRSPRRKKGSARR